MARLVAHFGLAHVSEKVMRRAGVNVAIELIFGKSLPAELADVNEGLKSYLTHQQLKLAGSADNSLDAMRRDIGAQFSRTRRCPPLPVAARRCPSLPVAARR